METSAKKIALACDHGGLALKNTIKKHFDDNGIEYIDFGCDTDQSCEYPDYGIPACKSVVSGECTLGILICSTGIGMSMIANKTKGIRAACCSDTYSARFTRLHNDANILCMGGKIVGPGLALDMVDLFVSTEFEGGRHAKRVSRIMELEM